MAKFLCAALLAALLYVGWYKFVLEPASRSTARWGSQRLARALSSLLVALLSRYLHITKDFRTLTACASQGCTLWAVHPHGLLTVSAFAACNMFPDARKMWVVGVAPAVFRTPLLSEFLLMVGARNVKLLDTAIDRVSLFALYPGGMHEQCATRPERERVFLSKNLGFVRAAMRRGIPIVPTYAFGENQLFHASDASNRLNAFVRRYLGVGALFTALRVGRWSLPVPIGFPRYGAALHLVSGRPVEVGLPAERLDEVEVQRVARLYVAELAALFDEHRWRLPASVAAQGLQVFVGEELWWPRAEAKL
jgi:hypothetical protein